MLNLQLFQSFPIEVTQNDSEWPILSDSQLFQSFPTEVAQNDLEQPILPDSQLFKSFSTEVAQNVLERPILQKKKKKKTHYDTANTAKKKKKKKHTHTMIQGNFYERLQFSMDSCAISPIAFMFIPMYLRLEGNIPLKK